MPVKNSSSKSARGQRNPTPQALSREQDVERNHVLAAVAYLWIFCLVPLLTKKDSPYAQFHAKQGVVLALAWFALWVVGIFPILGWLVFFFGSIVLVIVNLL